MNIGNFLRQIPKPFLNLVKKQILPQPERLSTHDRRPQFSRHSWLSVKTSKYPETCHFRTCNIVVCVREIQLKYELCAVLLGCNWDNLFLCPVKLRDVGERRFMQEWGIIITTYWKLDSQTQSCNYSDMDLAINFVKNNKILQTGKTLRSSRLGCSPV